MVDNDKDEVNLLKEIAKNLPLFIALRMIDQRTRFMSVTNLVEQQNGSKKRNTQMPNQSKHVDGFLPRCCAIPE